MRLIDADKLLEYGACPNDCNGTATCAEGYEHLHCPVRVFDIESINDAPTVKAISLDRIKQAREEMNTLPKDYEYALGVNACLEILDRLIESEG